LFIEVGTAEKAVEEVWKRRKAIARFMRDEYEKIVRGELRIFAFGLGGSGKTTLGKVLSGKLNLGEVPSSYRLSLATETYPVSGRTFATLYVPPGQKGDKQKAYIPDIIAKQGLREGI